MPLHTLVPLLFLFIFILVGFKKMLKKIQYIYINVGRVSVAEHDDEICLTGFALKPERGNENKIKTNVFHSYFLCL